MEHSQYNTLPSGVHEKYINQLKKSLPHWNGDSDALYFIFPMDIRFKAFSRNKINIGCDENYEKLCELNIDSIRELFRGNVNPGEFSDYPKEYIIFFSTVEKVISEYAEMNQINEIKDDVFIELYSTLRRRPDGKTISHLHDVMWQQIAFFLLCHECSEQEYTSCIQKLERGARKFHMNFSSHNYFDYIMDNF